MFKTSRYEKNESIDNFTSDSFNPSKLNAIDSILNPAALLVNRTSNMEAMIIAFIAEHSLPFSIASSLVELMKAKSIDQSDLSNVKLFRSTATYKMQFGLAKIYRIILLKT